MIEGQLRHLGDGKPFRIRGIGGGFRAMIGQFDQRVVSNADNALAGIAIKRSKAIKLLEKDVLQSRFLSQLAPGRVVQCFVHPHEPAWEGPLALERFKAALNQQHLEIGFIEAEHHAIDRQSRSRILIRVGHA